MTNVGIAQLSIMIFNYLSKNAIFKEYLFPFGYPNICNRTNTNTMKRENSQHRSRLAPIYSVLAILTKWVE